ncbi:hypothetical protein H2203_009136 [Taxawa tesnikishii (nom. ined.)]|nr:hypothetical protein H2203_009136 [Dothideales sp. JES 119]
MPSLSANKNQGNAAQPERDRATVTQIPLTEANLARHDAEMQHASGSDVHDSLWEKLQAAARSLGFKLPKRARHDMEAERRGLTPMERFLKPE